MKQFALLYPRSLIEASPDLLLTICSEGKIMDVTKATANITGLTYDEIIYSDFLEYFLNR
ncbi:PAS domain S-box protein [Proteiniphilum sp.]|jgi:PAS domain S-box-containing protein|uniref:PAS domain S-box protein n=1 Tax=Dysgonomonadaceae TaxID=2005520 RepID=UPI002B215E3D|nr:PAS domain S-box protein [Proteiniphilum sp.]MEA4997346.1 PAS domain S-box protein [Petrimonas sp.]MEA5129861.1 PAS domain S-box protein [Proteiniphilum sp.]